MNLSNRSGRIYTRNTTTTAALLASTLAADPADVTAVQGTSFGVDFNPVPDRLRVTSDVGQNLRINVNTGLAQLDAPLVYQAGDPNFGQAPVDVAVACSNNLGGAVYTALRSVDIAQDPDLPVIHMNPNGGTLQSSLSLPSNSRVVVADDISGLTGSPLFAVTPAASTSSLFMTGPGDGMLVGRIGGGVSILGLAAPVRQPVPGPARVVRLVVGVTGVLARALRRGWRP